MVDIAMMILMVAIEQISIQCNEQPIFTGYNDTYYNVYEPNQSTST